MNMASKALLIGFLFVGLVCAVAGSGWATPLPYLLLSPGIELGGLLPGSGYNPEGDVHSWGPLSTVAAYGVDGLLYSGLMYMALRWLSFLQRSR